MPLPDPAIEVCQCGHTRREHNPLMFRGVAVAEGHGECGVKGCACGKFTYYFSDDDVVDAMVGFAEQGFEGAANRHFSGAYSRDEEANRYHYKLWKAMKKRIRVLAKRLKG
jgi:hypothetical protein